MHRFKSDGFLSKNVNGATVKANLRQALAIVAKGAPKNERLRILIDGQSAGLVRTSASGVVSLATAPKSLTNKIASVILQTPDGKTVLSATF